MSDIYLEYRKGNTGIRVGGAFMGFLEPRERPDAILCTPWHKRMQVGPWVVPGSIKGRCDRCGGDVVVSPSSQLLLSQFPDVPTRCIYCVTKKEVGREAKENNESD